MRNIIIILCAAVMLATPALAADDAVKNIQNLFGTLYYSGYPYAKVVDFQYKKIDGDTDLESKWETQIKIKSCFKLPIYCQSSIYITDKEGNIVSHGEAQRKAVGTLFNHKITSLGNESQVKQIAFNKKNLESYVKKNAELSIHTECAPSLTHDQAIKWRYPPDHKFWDKFVQKNNDCEKE